MTLLPKIKLKSIVSFPATILDGVGVDVVKQNGSYQFNLAYDDFAPPFSGTTLPDASHLTSLLWNTTTNSYVLTPISVLGGQGGVANPLMDGAVQAGTALTFSHEDHRHPTDTTLVSKSANLSDIVDASTARQNLGIPAANVVINGDFRVNQSGYVSGAVLTAPAYGHDQWKAGASGGNYSFTQLKSSTQITIASGKSLIQPIEDVNVAGGSYVLTWTGTAQARAGVNTLTPAGTYAASPLLISGQNAGTAMSVEFNAGTLGTVKLESGANATPFVMRPYDQELLACQRYFYNGIPLWVGIGFNATSISRMAGRHPVQMRIAPNVVMTSAVGTSMGAATSILNNYSSTTFAEIDVAIASGGVSSAIAKIVSSGGGNINVDARL